MEKDQEKSGIHDAIVTSSEQVFQEMRILESRCASDPQVSEPLSKLRFACRSLQHASRILMAVRSSLRRESGKSMGEIIEGLCSLLVSYGGYESCWIVLTDGGGFVHTWASHGLGEGDALFAERLSKGWMPSCLDTAEANPRRHLMDGKRECCGLCPMGGKSWRDRAMIVSLEWKEIRYGTMAVAMPTGIPFSNEETLLVQEVAVELSHLLHDQRMEEARRHSEEGLEASQRSMDALLANLPGLAYRCRKDTQWTMLLVSEGAKALTGYDGNELLGNGVISYGELIHPEDRARVMAHVEEASSRGGPFELEYRIITRGGEVKWVWERGRLIPGGELVEGFITDITRRRTAQEELELSNRRYRTLVEDMPAMVCRFMPDGQLTDINESYCRMFGLTRADLLGNNFFNFLPEEARAEVKRHFQSLTPEHPMVTYEHEVITPDGGRGWQEWTDRALFSGAGEILEFQSIGRDTTERRASEERLRRNEQRYRAYLHNSPVAIFVLDDNGCFVEMNAVASHIVGFSREDLLAMRAQDIMWTDDGEESEKFSMDRLKREGQIRQEVCLKHHEGGVVFGILEAVVLEEGHYMAYFMDQTEHKALQAQLHQVQKIESVGRLAAGVAHDFNNMLSPIMGYAELLLEELAQGTEGYGFALEVKNAAERSRNLVRQLLAFSRKQVLSLDTLDLRDIILDMEVLLRRTLREDIAVDYGLDDLSCLVRADAGQVEQILMNLAVNAQDAMGEGGRLVIRCGRVTLNPGHRLTRTELLPGAYVLLEISDTGCGMDAHTRDHAFEPFFSTKGKGGTGLGLSTVYGIVKQHGGHVDMESKEGVGTIFSLYFPCTEDEPVSTSSRKTAARALSGTETLLMAEDNEVVKNMASSVLARQGYTVHKASSGEEALMLLESLSGRVDLLITDVVMPGMNGRELYTKVAERFPEIRVVYMSGYSDDVIAHHGVMEDGIHFIQKPFTIEGLTTKVREVLDIT